MTESRLFYAIFEREADGGFCVSVPALPGCFSQGDHFEEALANIREAIALYQEVMTERESDWQPEVNPLFTMPVEEYARAA